MPSNHVYYSIVDKMGYLWIATDKGVVKYNGYTCKIHDLSTGLANNDVWKLYEDIKGRIWLSTITNELGYIYRDKYKKPFLPPTSTTLFYPKEVVDIPGGIAYIHYDNSGQTVRAVINDTVYTFPLGTGKEGNMYFLSSYGLTTVQNNILYKYVQGIATIHKKIITGTFENTPQRKKSNKFYINFGRYIISYKYESDSNFYIINTSNGEKKQVNICSLENESIYTPYIYKNRFYTTTNKRIFRFNDRMEVQRIYVLDSLRLPENSYILNLLEDNFWGHCIGTANNGLYINVNKRGLQPMALNLEGYKYAGHSLRGTYYWWNKSTHALMEFNQSLSPSITYHRNIKDIRKIIPYDSIRSLAITADVVYWLLKDVKTAALQSPVPLLFSKDIPVNSTPYIAGNITASAKTPDGNLYYTSRGSGLSTMFNHADTLVQNVLSGDRVLGVVYDSVSHSIWAYDQKQVLIYNINKNNILKFDNVALERYGIKKIEKIETDKYGNIFIKEYNRLIIYHPQKNTSKEILNNLHLSDVTITIQNNKLIAAGQFGILFCNINGPLQVSRPYMFYNVKKIYYNEVRELHTWNDKAVIITDKGTFEAQLPANAFSAKTENTYTPGYKFHLTYNDSTREINSNDTINISQKNRSLYFDIINPAGNGSVKYTSYIAGTDSAKNELEAAELHLPELQPDKYYTLYITAHDDVWKSPHHKIHLYIIPYWWQTTTGIRIIWISTFIIAMLLVYFIVYITKRNVSKKHMKQNLQLELKNLQLAFELKSIYSQINPHFIFNTLSTGLYFIKKKRIDKAYNHISSFSDLLRAYIKSSRSKYITIAEEITNLTNYISLQQARFENKFDYHIIIDNSVSASGTYIPTLLLQPLVENAINHGLLPLEDRKGTLTIEFKKSNESEILCTIDDDGIGREQSKQYAQKSKVQAESYGTELIKELIEVFNKNEHIHISLHYIDKTPPLHGTTVIITIKYKDHEQ